MATPRTEEYLEAIFKLQEISREPVSITRVADYLRLSAASASEMIKRLKRDGCVAYGPGREVSLTKEGRRQASRVIRRHRLAERLLTDILHFKWDEIHEEACKLEHVISPEVERRLAASLGNPATCPHGHPIPSENGDYPQEDIMPLASAESGREYIVDRVEENNPEILKYLTKLAVKPGIVIKVVEIAPFSGPLTLVIGKKKHTVGRELAGFIMVKA